MWLLCGYFVKGYNKIAFTVCFAAVFSPVEEPAPGGFESECLCYEAVLLDTD
jgi:hypothetical protein